MGAVGVDGPNEPRIESVEEMAGRFTSELMTHISGWRAKIIADPESLGELEREVHSAFTRGADLILAGLLAVVMRRTEFLEAAEKTRRGFSQPLERGRERTIRVRLLGGLIVWISSLYCAARKSAGASDKGSGLYIELAQFGCGKGVTPGLESRVARQVALCPSLDLAREELMRSGVTLDVKAVRRIAYQCGDGLLQLRKQQLMQWREGRLPAGTELRDCHVTVQIDGGRTRIRGDLRANCTTKSEKTNAEGLVIENAPGRSKKPASQTYDAEWREPKLIAIFIHDECGRMVKGSKTTIDGTFLGPDATAELVAMHLHRLGAAEALSVTFAADGAIWIWDRIERIAALAKIEHVPIYQVLDCCHAAHHISQALAAFGSDSETRMCLYREHRSLLRNGQWRRVVEELEELSGLLDENSKAKADMLTEIAYLRKHGEAGRMSYPHFRSLGIPLGSGAIESSIRRVINLRLKSNSMFWREPHAETMLQIRAQVISGRWDERLREMRQLRRNHARTDWKWIPQPMSSKNEPETATAV